MQVNFWSFTRIAKALVRGMIRARSGPHRRDRLGGGAAGQSGQCRLRGLQGRADRLLPHARDRDRQARHHRQLVAPGFIDTDMMAPYATYRDSMESRSRPAASPSRRRSPASSPSCCRPPPPTSPARTCRSTAALTAAHRHPPLRSSMRRHRSRAGRSTCRDACADPRCRPQARARSTCRRAAAAAAPARCRSASRRSALNHLDVWGFRGMAFAKRKLPLRSSASRRRARSRRSATGVDALQGRRSGRRCTAA